MYVCDQPDRSTDATLTVYVKADDKASDGYTSDNEDNSTLMFDDEQNHTPVTSSASPPKGAMPAALVQHAHNPEHSPGSHLQGAQFLDANAIQPRGGQYPQHLMGAELAQEPGHYGEGGAMPTQGSLHPGPNMAADMYATSHDSSRRSSYVNASAEYSSPTQALYHQGWGGPGTTPPGTSTMYAFTPTSAVGPAYGQGGVALAQNQQALAQGQPYLGVGNFDGLPGRGEEVGPGSMYRAGSLSQASVPYSQGYQNYLPQETRAVLGIKTEGHARSSLP